jgi:hypothetical protein
MNVNGLLMYSRSYNAASTAAQPAVFAIQIGKGLKGRSLDLYKSVGKVTAGSLDSVFDATLASGLTYDSYNELTGVLIVDAGASITGADTARRFDFSDATIQTSGYLVINASKSPALTGVPLLQPRIATLSDVKASGTAGQSLTGGVYNTRQLNTLDDSSGIGITLASNQFTLPAGQYYIEGSAPVSVVTSVGVNSHKIKIRNITDGTDAIIGTSELLAQNNAGTAASNNSRIAGLVTISSSKVFELQHRTQTTGNGGVAAAFGDSEVYSIVKITKVK